MSNDIEREAVMKRGKTEAETIALNGWKVGDILEGDEGYGPDRILITAIGEERFTCKWYYKATGTYDRESGNTTLSCRNWRKVGYRSGQAARDSIAGAVPEVGAMADILGEELRRTQAVYLTQVTLVDMIRKMLPAAPTAPALEGGGAPEIHLDDVIVWADGILGDLGTEHSGKVTDKEAAIASAVMLHTHPHNGEQGEAPTTQPTGAGVPDAYAVIEHTGQIGYTAAVIRDGETDGLSAEHARNLCHEHINEAAGDGVEGAGKWVVRPLTIGTTQPTGGQSFQDRVAPWMQECFGPEISADKVERNHRFLEESLELVQSLGCTKAEAMQLVDYVYGRPAGDPPQEVGGVRVTLAALCLASGMDQDECAETELARIWTKVPQIRAKQAAKPKHSPLPQHVDGEQGGEWVRCDERLPTEADADCHKQVWVYNDIQKRVHYCEYWAVKAYGYSWWMPTGLTRPQPPKSKEVE